MSWPLRVALILIVLLASAGPTNADTWSSDFSNNWFVPGAWIGLDGPPGATETAIFPAARDVFGTPSMFASTDVQLSASTTIKALGVDSPLNAQYTFHGSGGAVLTVTEQAEFTNVDAQALNVHTFSSLGLDTPLLRVLSNAVLSLSNSTVTTNDITFFSGRIEVNSGSSLQTQRYNFNNASGELRVNSGGELRVTGDTQLLRGTTTINSGGQLNAAAGVDLEYNGTALLQFSSGHAVDNLVHLKATGGGDISGASFIDVGNGVVGTLTVTGDGSTFTSGGSVSDWGLGAAGNATVTVSDSATATVATLRAGTSDGRFVGTVSNGATLRTTAGFTMGGGSAIRQVSLDVSGGTLQTDGLATFNNRATLNLAGGTVNFNGGATFNAGSLAVWAGGSMNLGANSTLLIDGTDVAKTSNSGFIYSGNTTTRIRNGGNFSTPGYFDFGNATLDMNAGFLTAGAANSTVSDWGASATTTATLTNNARATYNSGLRMSFGGGTTSATISGGARLIANELLTAGGAATSSVTLNVNGGFVESNATISLLRGVTTTVTNAGRIVGQDIVLGSASGTTNLTVTGVGSLLDANGALVAGRQGATTLTISGGAQAESTGSTILGELIESSSTFTVTGSGSTLRVGTSLTVGAAGIGQLEILNQGL
jgi:T5SS/PEP-CTERM-associated repeat protein